MRTLAYILAFCAMLGAASVCTAALRVDVMPPEVATPALPETVTPVTPSEPEPPKPLLNDACRLKGVVVCSEYGARQKEELFLILTDENGYRYDAVVYKDDGTFYTRIPCSGRYGMSMELGGGRIDLGELTLPAADENATYDLRIIHPGSLLELILEVRSSGESDLTCRPVIVVPSRGY